MKKQSRINGKRIDNKFYDNWISFAKKNASWKSSHFKKQCCKNKNSGECLL